MHVANFAYLKIICKDLKKGEIYLSLASYLFFYSILFPYLCTSLLIWLSINTNYTNTNCLNSVWYYRTNRLFQLTWKSSCYLFWLFFCPCFVAGTFLDVGNAIENKTGNHFFLHIPYNLVKLKFLLKIM